MNTTITFQQQLVQTFLNTKSIITAGTETYSENSIRALNNFNFSVLR